MDCKSPDLRGTAVTGLPPLCWPIIFSSIARVIAAFFSPEAGDMYGSFVPMMGCENTKQYPKNAGNTVHCRVSVACTRDGRADGQLWPAALTGTASLRLHITSPGKDQYPKFQVQFLRNVHCFRATAKLKNCKSEPSVLWVPRGRNGVMVSNSHLFPQCLDVLRAPKDSGCM